MVYLYIDESGDLGFSKGGSKYFILSCVKMDNEETNKQFRRIPKKIRQRMLSKKMKEQPELKFSNSSVLIREQFLSRVAKLNVEIYSIIIKKEYTQKQLRDNLPILYNYLMKVLLEQPLQRLKKPNELHICLDRCMSLGQRENFESYIKTEFLSIFKEIPNLKIVHENSCNDGGLQVIDFICGAFGYKYNTSSLEGDFDHYLAIIKDKVVLEKHDMFKKK